MGCVVVGDVGLGGDSEQDVVVLFLFRVTTVRNPSPLGDCAIEGFAVVSIAVKQLLKLRPGIARREEAMYHNYRVQTSITINHGG